MRGVILMALSNQEGHLVLTTGNKSELAVGYSTLYGDSVGGFTPIKDVPKTLVWQLARWRNDEAGPARRDRRRSRANSITKPPSAELRPGQLDTDSLPDYDAARRDPRRLRRRRPRARRAASPPATTRRWSTGCCAWSTSPSTSAGSPRPGPKISIKAFGRDRRLPITNRFREATSGDHAVHDLRNLR